MKLENLYPGDPERQAKFVQRFWGYVDSSGGPDACHLWTGTISGHNSAKGGYGYTSYASGKRGGKRLQAHRVSYMLANGEVPDDKLICHTCDVRHCVNPRHLFVGTHEDNVRDCIAKERNRNGVLPGESNPMAKLSESDVITIRHRYAAGEKQSTLASVFGVHPESISKIVTRKRWKHIPEEVAK